MRVAKTENRVSTTRIAIRNYPACSVFMYVKNSGKKIGQGRDAATKRAVAGFRKPALSRVRRVA